MIRRPLLAAASALAFALPVPLAAQEGETASSDSAIDAAAADADAELQGIDDFTGLLGDLFPAAEPLTPQQEAVLPLAQEVVIQIFPEGTYTRMMGETMQPMLDSMMGTLTDLPLGQVQKLTGLYGDDFSQLGEGTIDEAMAILDPAFGERNKRIGDVTIELVTEVMTEIEPAYRAGLARAYAVRFNEAELADLKRYFSTPVGSKYAAESMLIYADPQVMSAMNELMPSLMALMPRMIERMDAINALLPQARRYSELDANEQARLAQLLGVTPGALSEAEPQDWGEGADYGGEDLTGDEAPAAPETQASEPGEVAAPAA